jgi:preprotein translocase SecE subunit
MADEKKTPVKRDDPRTLAARQRAAAIAKAGPGFTWSGFVQFLKDTWSELKKTTWPDRNTLGKSTMIVLAFIAAAALWEGGLDLILTHITNGLFGK